MNQTEQLKEGAEKAVENSAQARKLLKMIEGFSLQIVIASTVGPHMMKDIKSTDPETYYGLKTALKNFEQTAKEILPMLSKELEAL